MNAVEIEQAISDLALQDFDATEFPFAFLAEGEVSATLQALRASPATAKAKARFILATDGQTLEAEELTSGDTIAPALYKDDGGGRQQSAEKDQQRKKP